MAWSQAERLIGVPFPPDYFRNPARLQAPLGKTERDRNVPTWIGMGTIMDMDMYRDRDIHME